MYGSPETKINSTNTNETLRIRQRDNERSLGRVATSASMDLDEYLKVHEFDVIEDESQDNGANSPESNKKVKTEIVESNSRDLIKVSLGKERNISTVGLTDNTAVAVIFKNKNKSGAYIQNYSPENDLKSTQTLAELLRTDMPRGSKVEQIIILTPEGKNKDTNGKQLPKNELLTSYLKSVVEISQDKGAKTDAQIYTYKKIDDRDITDDEVKLRAECHSDGTTVLYIGSEVAKSTPEV